MLKRVHLRQFLALVDSGSFTAAADKLHVTQPTLSAGIAELERVTGTPLFVRERRNIRLTEAGNRLLTHARAIEREFRAAEASVTDATPPAPALRLGVLASLATPMLSTIVAAYEGRQPVVLTEGLDADLRRRLAEHRLDAALTLLRDGEQAECVVDEGYAMLLPESHRLARHSLLTADELAGETMIARRSCEILAETSRFFTARGVRPRFSFRSPNEDRCLALVRAGAGITTGPVSLAGNGVVAVPVEGYDFRRRVGLVLAADQAAPAWFASVSKSVRA